MSTRHSPRQGLINCCLGQTNTVSRQVIFQRSINRRQCSSGRVNRRVIPPGEQEEFLPCPAPLKRRACSRVIFTSAPRINRDKRAERSQEFGRPRYSSNFRGNRWLMALRRRYAAYPRQNYASGLVLTAPRRSRLRRISLSRAESMATGK